MFNYAKYELPTDINALLELNFTLLYIFGKSGEQLI